MRFDVRIPGLIRQALGPGTITIEASTLPEVFTALRKTPKLGPLIFDESAALRPHVLVAVNETVYRAPEPRTLEATDKVAVLQAISGG